MLAVLTKHFHSTILILAWANSSILTMNGRDGCSGNSNISTVLCTHTHTHTNSHLVPYHGFDAQLVHTHIHKHPLPARTHSHPHTHTPPPTHTHTHTPH